MTSPTTTPGSKVGRARRRFSQLWQVPAFLLGVLAFLGAAASAPWRHPPQWWEFDALLMTLRRGLEQDTAADPLVEHAEAIHARVARFPERAPEAHFLIGSAYYRQARQKPAIFAREVWPRAAEHLEKAHEHAPTDDTTRLALKYRLGYCLYQQKKELPRAIELMTLSVDKGAEQPLDGYRLLVEANLALTPPNVDSALTASQRILDLTPERDVEAVSLARLQQAELLLLKQARLDAYRVLEHIGSKTSRPVRIKAKLLQARACEEDGLWHKAVGIWQDLSREATHVEGGRARIDYAMGWCYHQMEPPNNVETIRVWSDALKIGGPEGQAAGLHLGDLRLSMGDKYAALALADWKQALVNVKSPEDFKNPHIELAEVAKLFEHALKRFDLAQDPDKAQQVAELYRKIAPSGIADQRRAKAAEELAEKWLDQFKNGIGKVTLADVQAQFRRAGDNYALAAKALPEDQRPESLWRSAQCYLSAKDIPLALKALTEHVQIEPSEARLAEARFTLGDLYRAQGDKKLARDAFIKCIEIPDTPFASRSRYFLALEEIDKKAYEKAHEILAQNLRDGYPPSFDRPAHEKTLYKMAWLAQQMKKYDEARVYLIECQRLYPENPNVMLAREQLGECYRQLAKKELIIERDLNEQIKAADLSEERRETLRETARAHKQKRVRWLTDAVKTYEALADELEKQSAQGPLNALEKVLQRRARFGIGECHLDNEEFSESLRVFKELQTKHRCTLEGLYACLRICNMVAVMNAQGLPKKQVDTAKERAMEALRLLSEDLRSLPENSEIFRRPDVPTREEWQRWLDATQLRLLTPAKKENPLPFIR